MSNLIKPKSTEAIIVLGGGLDSQGNLSPKLKQRMDTGVDAYRNEIAPNLIVSGGRSFLAKTSLALSEAEVMKRYAEDNGIPKDLIFVEKKSLDTVGNALFTKQQIVVPNNWDHLALITSESHSPRAEKIFNFVFGKDFSIQVLPAPEKIGPKEKLQETVASIMLREIFKGINSGDDEAIRERLFEIVPGYGKGTVANLAMRSLTGFVRKNK